MARRNQRALFLTGIWRVGFRAKNTSTKRKLKYKHEAQASELTDQLPGN